MLHRFPSVRRPRVAWALALTLCACQTSDSERYAAVARRAEPSLEDIFWIPGIHGEPPRIHSLAADGEWMAVQWRRAVTGEDGRRRWAEEDPLRLIDVARPAESTQRELALRDVLERATGESSPTRAASRRGRLPRSEIPFTWSPRGHELAAWWNGALWLVALESGSPPRATLVYRDPALPEAEDEPEGEGPPAEEAVPRPARPERLGRVEALEFSEDGCDLVVRAAGELAVFPLRSLPLPLSLSDAAIPTEALEIDAGDVQLSRDRRVAFAPSKAIGKIARAPAEPGGAPEEVDAQVLELATGTMVALEGYVAGDSFEDAALSPDGRFVFAREVDRGGMPAPTIVPDYLTNRVTTIEGRRQLADDLPLASKLWVWTTADGARRAIDIPGDGPFYFHDVGWASQRGPGAPARMAFHRLALDFRTLEVWLWTEGALELLLVDRDERWIGGPAPHARFSRDGTRILFASESYAASTTRGRCQIFELDLAARAVRQLTEVEGEVSEFAERDDGAIVFAASRGDPRRRELGWIEPGTRAVRWLELVGGFLSEPRLSKLGERVFFRRETVGEPAEIWAGSLGAAEPPRRLTHTVPSAYAAVPWIRPVPLSARSADGTEVRAHVYLPRATSLGHPDRRRACVVFIHGAGYLQNVTDSMTQYAVNLLFHSRLASMGYVVLDVDFRGSEGYGGRFRTDVQFQLGKLELEDIAACVDELARRGVIDPRRVGCYGGSYGGFLTLMALFTQGERWTCGAALRSVTDWRTYTPGYTQPRLGRPSTHAEAYAASSPIDLAGGLRDPLLILHGMVDTNVFAQDSVRLIEKLIDLGRDFEAMLYPSQGHAFEDGAHWIDEYGRIERFLVRHLGAP
jgi:dienelactone hydrolase